MSESHKDYIGVAQLTQAEKNDDYFDNILKNTNTSIGIVYVLST